MKKSKIYTKTGDDGKTSLLGGKRVFKSNLRVEVYGQIDELNSYVGYLNSTIDATKCARVNDTLTKIQSALFEAGSFFACDSDKITKNLKLNGVSSEVVLFLEREIDLLDSDLKPLCNFILPGGDQKSSIAHICRAIARRVERVLVLFYKLNEKKGKKNATILAQIVFINRLSDYFFVLGRWLNNQSGIADIFWKKN